MALLRCTYLWLPDQDPELAAEYEHYMHSLKDVLPITPEVKAILRSHYDFDTTPVRNPPHPGCQTMTPPPSCTRMCLEAACKDRREE